MLPSLNSGDFPDIVDSVEHSKTNPINLENISMKLNYKGLFIMNEPNTVLERYRNIIMTDLEELPWEDKYVYRPEGVSEYLYDTPDLWHLILMANSLINITSFKNLPVIKFVSVSKLNNILKMIKDHEMRLKDSVVNPHKIEDRTLKNIHF